MERDVAGITAAICTTLEHFGNVSNRSFLCITLSISETVMWPNPRIRRKLAYIFCSASRISPSILLKLSNAVEAFFIRFFTVTESSQSKGYFMFISSKPELKLRQHLVDGRIVSVHLEGQFHSQLHLSFHGITYKVLKAAR